MSDRSVTSSERKRLFALMVVATEVTNRDLRRLTGFDLDRTTRERLKEFKLIQSWMVRGAFVHELTDKGWAWCRDEMAAPLPEGRDPSGKLLQALLNSLNQFFLRSEITPSEIFGAAYSSTTDGRPADETVVAERTGKAMDEPNGNENVHIGDLDDRIRAAYRELRPQPGAWVRLARIRRHLEDVVQADLDDALRRLNSAPGVVIAPDSDQGRLSPEDRAAAVRIGGEDNHLLLVEGP